MKFIRKHTLLSLVALSLIVSLALLGFHFLKPLNGNLSPAMVNPYLHDKLSYYINAGSNFPMDSSGDLTDNISVASKSFFRYDLTQNSLDYLKKNNPGAREEDLEKTARRGLEEENYPQLVQGVSTNWIEKKNKDPLEVPRPKDAVLFLKVLYKDGKMDILDAYTKEDRSIQDFQKILLSNLNPIMYDSGNHVVMDSMHQKTLPWSIPDEDVDIGLEMTLDTAKITLAMNQTQYNNFMERANFELRIVNLVKTYLLPILLVWIISLFVFYQVFKGEERRRGFVKFLDFFPWEVVILLVFTWFGSYVLAYEARYDLARSLKVFGDTNSYVILSQGLFLASFTILLSAAYLGLRINQVRDKGAHYGFIQKTLVYKVITGIRSIFGRSISNLERSVLSGKETALTNPMNRPMLILAGAFIFIVLAFLILFPPISLVILALAFLLAGFFIYDFSGEMGRIIEGSNEIVKGNYDYKIPVEKTYFKGIANNFNRISSNLDGAVKEAVESAQVQSRLITNVGHDLKTPLTSILNYADLLSQEDDPDKMKDYARTIHDKSLRLKVLIDQLFEVSKSGKEVKEEDLADLNLRDLLNQVLGEWEDQFKKKGLSLMSQIDGQLPVRLDGNRAYRIFDNLCSNIYKYSLEGTRVYIQGFNQDSLAQVVFKNISKDPLSLDQDYTSRFTRGDASRTSEGYGLGLAIAKSLSQQMGGNLDLSLDGDLFKIKVTFPIRKEEV